jgi:TRAP-type uncharacterized transport system fused permease subunit
MIIKTENSLFAQVARHLRQGLFLLFAVLLVAGTLYTARFGIYDDALVRVGGLALGILLLLSRPSSKVGLTRLILDLGLCVLLIAALIRYAMIAEALETGLYFLEPIDVVFGVGALIVLLEMARRMVGLPLVLVCLVGIAYGLFGDQLGGMLSHSGLTLPDMTFTLWYSFDGVFGRPLAVVVSTIIIFIIFGACWRCWVPAKSC